MSIAPSTIITTVPVAGIVPRSVIRIPIPIGRSAVSICRWGIAVGNRRSIISIAWAADDGTYKRSCCP
jgi:hypothetical protein